MNKKEKTAPEVSAATDTGQSSLNSNNSITDWDEDCNSAKKSFEELRKELNEQSSSAYMKTVSMNELFETSFDNKTPLIDGLLYTGTYLFAGSPKVGKLLGVDIKANALTMKLNVNAGRLFNEYKIVYENKRCHDGRKVRLTLNQA